ncbi:hypothetical protein BJY52DRAFT_1414449 [Lactarius psammicola]|nr:hypothetical protein BJY52DRAFT_1414449 [Lactarius psammicola]
MPEAGGDVGDSYVTELGDADIEDILDFSQLAEQLIEDASEEVNELEIDDYQDQNAPLEMEYFWKGGIHNLCKEMEVYEMLCLSLAQGLGYIGVAHIIETAGSTASHLETDSANIGQIHRFRPQKQQTGRRVREKPSRSGGDMRAHRSCVSQEGKSATTAPHQEQTIRDVTHRNRIVGGQTTRNLGPYSLAVKRPIHPAAGVPNLETPAWRGTSELTVAGRRVRVSGWRRGIVRPLAY